MLSVVVWDESRGGRRSVGRRRRGGSSDVEGLGLGSPALSLFGGPSRKHHFSLVFSSLCCWMSSADVNNMNGRNDEKVE